MHHIALLIGCGAAAVNPYLAMETIEDLVAEGDSPASRSVAVRNYLRALGKGVLKLMSKMGISTVGSYTAAQVFEAIGLSREVVDEYFTGTVSRLGGVGLDVLAREVELRHRAAYPENPSSQVHRRLDVGGIYQYRRDGELHLFTPETVFLLQHATRTGRATSSRSTARRSIACPRRAGRCGDCSSSGTGCAHPCLSRRWSRRNRSSRGSTPAP